MVENFESEDDSGEEEESFVSQHKIVVDKGQDMVRLDRFLTDKTANASRNKIQQSIDSEIVKVNGLPSKANYKIKPGDVITYWVARQNKHTDVLPESIPLDIIYEDDD